MTRLPSSAGGRVTQEVGFFDVSAAAVGDWLREGLGKFWSARPIAWTSLADATRELSPATPLSRYALIPIGSWTVLLNNGPQGTDVGLLPSQAARELGCRAVRAVCVEDSEAAYPARILEIFGPDGMEPLRLLRSIVVANDGGEWVFETTGEPLEFERVDQYVGRRKTDRFTSALVHEYLRQLHVPIDLEPVWAHAILVERRPF